MKDKKIYNYDLLKKPIKLVTSALLTATILVTSAIETFKESQYGYFNASNKYSITEVKDNIAPKYQHILAQSTTRLDKLNEFKSFVIPEGYQFYKYVSDVSGSKIYFINNEPVKLTDINDFGRSNSKTENNFLCPVGQHIVVYTIDASNKDISKIQKPANYDIKSFVTDKDKVTIVFSNNKPVELVENGVFGYSDEKDDTLTIGTFNVKDIYGDIFYNGIDSKGQDNAELLSKYIVQNEIDVLGTQEIVSKYVDRLGFMLPGYKLIGCYRWGYKLPISYANEANSIITDEKVLEYNTEWLPYFPDDVSKIVTNMFDIMPRIATSAVIEKEGFGRVFVLNTHLDYKLGEVQKKQLDALYDIIVEAKKNYENIIITGDFNMSISNPYFIEFVNKLKVLGIELVEINEQTQKDNKESIDHIFLSNNLVVIAKQVGDKDLDTASDHTVVKLTVRSR